MRPLLPMKLPPSHLVWTAKATLFLLALAVISHATETPLPSRDLRVDPDKGSDASETGPFKTIARAIAIAKPGDTIHLAPATYANEPVMFRNKSGEPGKPITLDGHGAIIDGSDPLIESDWQQVSPGLYRNTALYAKPLFKNVAFTSRFGLVMNGRLNRMGRSAKGRCDPYKTVADLQNGEWTYRAEDGHAYYLKIDPATTLASHAIRVPTRLSAVQIYGNVSHIVIRNITGRHTLNDGFGLTTGSAPSESSYKIRDIVYENIKAFECCDDGMSSHADCELRVDGFEVDGCATGVANCGSDIIDRLVVRNTHGMDVYYYGGRHVLKNSRVQAGGNLAALKLTTQFGNAKWLADPAHGALYDGWDRCVLRVENVVFDSSQLPDQQPGKVVISDRCTLETNSEMMSGLSPEVAKGGALKLTDKPLPAPAPAAKQDSALTRRIYRETFDDGPGGWLGWNGKGIERLEIRDGAMISRGPWWIDYNHAPPGGGYLHLLYVLYTQATSDEKMTQVAGANRFAAAGFPRDFTNAKMSVRIKGDVKLRGAQLMLLVQGKVGDRWINHVLEKQPIKITPEWSEQTITLEPDAAQWKCLGSRHDRMATYGWGEIADLLRDVNADLILVLHPLEVVPAGPINGDPHRLRAGHDYAVDTSRLPEGMVMLDEVKIEFDPAAAEKK